MDLVFNINFIESKKLKKIILETYLGKIKILKNKTFSGQIIKTDLNIKDINNIRENELSFIKKTILNSENIKIKKYKYIIESNNIFNIFNILIKYKSLYLTTEDRKMHLIENIYFCNSIKYENLYKDKNNTKLYVLINDTKTYIHKDMKIFINGNQTIVFKNNSLIFIDKYYDDGAVDSYLKNKKINSYEKLENIFTHDIETKLYIKINKNYIEGNLFFDYAGLEIPQNNMDSYIIIGNKKYYRNLNKEEDMIQWLERNSWKKVSGNTFKIKSFTNEIIDKCINKGIKLYYKDCKKEICSYSINMNIGYEIDWFEVNGEVTIDNEKYDLYEILNKSKDGKYIEVNNKVVILSEILMALRNNIIKNKKKIIYSRKKIGEILELSKCSNVSENKKIKKFLDYNSINIDLPKFLNNNLRDYQIKGSKWMKYLYKNHFGGCLADDMGLGKTIQVIGFLSDKNYNANENLSLIVVPKTLLSNWEKEIKKFNPSLNVKIYHGSKKGDIDKGVVLTTYQTLVNNIDILIKYTFQCLILDEIQNIKNPNTKAYKAINNIDSVVRIGLSGTPFENNLGEVWAIMNIINPKIWGEKNDFIKRYDDILENKVLSEELNTRISPYMLRRTKKQVLKSLPKKIEKNIYCDMTEKQEELYNMIRYKVKKDIDRLPNRFEIKMNATILKGLLYLRETCCHPEMLPSNYNINNCKESGKFEVLQSKVSDIVCNKKKVIIFSSFTSMLKIIEKWIVDKGYKYYYLDGKTRNRQSVIESFENSDEGIFLISIKTGGVGLNLVSCQYVIIFDPWWNPALENQASDRVYRIGQKKNVIIYKLITNNSIEEKIIELQEKKKKMGESIFYNLNNIKKISINEVKELIEK